MSTEKTEDGDTSTDTLAAELGLDTDQPKTHGESVIRLADANLRYALWPGVATVVIGIAASAVFAGLEGALGALVGGVVAFASSLATLWLMRKTSALPPIMVMAVALGGFAGKMVLLLVIMTLVRPIDWLHPRALAYTMLATVLVWAAMETVAFRKTKIPTLITETNDQ
jgi:hypothetical protein